MKNNRLHTYMYDYFLKRGWQNTARSFLQEARLTSDYYVPIDAPEGFLYEWWTVFWDIFDANHSRTGTSQAAIYLEVKKEFFF